MCDDVTPEEIAEGLQSMLNSESPMIRALGCSFARQVAREAQARIDWDKTPRHGNTVRFRRCNT